MSLINARAKINPHLLNSSVPTDFNPVSYTHLVKVAKVMFVVGTQAPDYKNNLALAEKMMELLNEIHPQLCERVLEVDTNYNQNISDHALLIEVGDNAVTAEEASRAAEYVAQALAELHGVMW